MFYNIVSGQCFKIFATDFGSQSIVSPRNKQHLRMSQAWFIALFFSWLLNCVFHIRRCLAHWVSHGTDRRMNFLPIQ